MDGPERQQLVAGERRELGRDLVEAVDPEQFLDLALRLDFAGDGDREDLGVQLGVGFVRGVRPEEAEVLGLAGVELEPELLGEFTGERLDRDLALLELAAGLHELGAAALAHQQVAARLVDDDRRRRSAGRAAGARGSRRGDRSTNVSGGDRRPDRQRRPIGLIGSSRSARRVGSSKTSTGSDTVVMAVLGDRPLGVGGGRAPIDGGGASSAIGSRSPAPARARSAAAAAAGSAGCRGSLVLGQAHRPGCSADVVLVALRPADVVLEAGGLLGVPDGLPAVEVGDGTPSSAG